MFIVLEIQLNANDQVATLVNAYADRFDAENKYHTVLAAAAKSTLPKHAASMFDEEGMMIKHEYFTHPEA